MSRVINPIIEAGGTTAHRDFFDSAKMQSVYVLPDRKISCVVAELRGEVVGFQALEWADPAWPGEDRIPPDWGVIATFVAIPVQASGVGAYLFTATLGAAREAKVVAIDATIRPENAPGLRYYSALGFVDYAKSRERVSKRFDLEY